MVGVGGLFIQRLAGISVIHQSHQRIWFGIFTGLVLLFISFVVDSFDSWDHYRSADSESSREMMYNICKANSQYASNSDVGEELCQDEVNSYVSNYAFYFALSIVKLIAVLLIGYGFLNLKEYLHIKEIEFKQSLRPSPSTSGQISPDGFEWLSLDDGTKWYRRANSGDQYQKSS